MRNKKVPYVPQMEAVECGAASLAGVLAFWGHYAPLPEVREACKVNRDGASAFGILEAARLYGLSAEGVSLEAEHLGDLPLPAILHWEFNHFIVLERLTKWGGWVVDPACGRRRVTNVELRDSFTGVALCFEPKDGDFQVRKRRFPSLHRYRGALKGLGPSLLQVLGGSVMLQLAGLVIPMGNRFLVDHVLLPRRNPWLWGISLALLLAVVARVALTLLRSYVLQGIRANMDRHLMHGLVNHLVGLPLGFFLQRQPGDLVQRVESNIQVRDLFSGRSVSAVLDILLVASYAALMLAYNVPLGLTVLALAGVRVALLLGLRSTNEQVLASELVAVGQERSVLMEAMSGMETLKASGSEEFVLHRWTDRLIKRLNLSATRMRYAAVSAQAMVLVQGLVMGAVCWIGGREVLLGRMTIGVFAGFVALQGMFTTPLESLLTALVELQYIGSHLTRLDDIMESPPEPSGTKTPQRLSGLVSLEAVSFRYNEGSPLILQEISLEIRPGEKVAIVGRTGAGKSTLARLLMGMHLPTQGTIRFDGTSLHELDLQKVRAQMGVVLQETFLFDDTVQANLSIADPETHLERIKWAVRLACVDDVIDNLPDGYRTRLGENARTLSGGEGQRLCIARAIVGSPAMLLLDEATSALDLDTESKVHAHLSELGCTRILIAHRLETLRDADRILVLESGKIVQDGKFDDLASRPGHFQDIVNAKEGSGG